MKTVYLARENSDQTEGRGHLVTLAAFEKEEDARAAVKGKGAMGRSDGVVAPLLVFVSFNEYLEHRRADLKTSVLRKLTPKEREVFGL